MKTCEILLLAAMIISQKRRETKRWDRKGGKSSRHFSQQTCAHTRSSAVFSYVIIASFFFCFCLLSDDKEQDTHGAEIFSSSSISSINSNNIIRFSHTSRHTIPISIDHRSRDKRTESSHVGEARLWLTLLCCRFALVTGNAL